MRLSSAVDDVDSVGVAKFDPYSMVAWREKQKLGLMKIEAYERARVCESHAMARVAHLGPGISQIGAPDSGSYTNYGPDRTAVVIARRKNILYVYIVVWHSDFYRISLCKAANRVE